ncbi:MAG: iron ABC transporter ATP-binding protein FetA [Polyangiales bacterium]
MVLPIEARNIGVSRGDTVVLKGASLKVANGEIATVEGASGCGKTTLLRVMATLLAPNDGAIYLDDLNALAMSPGRFRKRVAYVAQQAPMLEGSVADNVRAGPALRNQVLEARAITDILHHVGLAPGFADRSAKDLSGGERQRVALARALANEPAVLLLDEPTAALDESAARTIVDLVRSLAKEGLSIVVVSHHVEHIQWLAGTRYLCKDHRLTTTGWTNPK